jgi:Asp-tRNA(Asn)/Glu-tRNA(Gln) amidotransferase A subunit family amidase
MEAAVRQGVERLRRAGVKIVNVDITEKLAALYTHQQVIQRYESARVHLEHYKHSPELLGPDWLQVVREGMAIPQERYDEALRFMDRTRREFAAIYKGTPIILTPGATGPAPRLDAPPPPGYTTMGDPRMNGPFTPLGGPVITIPLPVGTSMPLGLQMSAERGEDAHILQTAAHFEQLLADGEDFTVAAR